MRWIGPVRAGFLTTLCALAIFVGWPALSSSSGLFQQLERWSLDARFRLRGAMPITERIAVVALDDASLERYGDELAKRAGFARLISAVRADGAKVIGVDAFFAEEERVLPPQLVKDIEAHLLGEVDAVGRALFGRVLEEERGDEKLVEVLGAKADVVLALHAGEHMGLDNVRSDLTKATYGQLVAGPDMPVGARRLLASLPSFHEAAARVGIATIVVGADDQTARRVHAGRTFSNRVLVPFSVQLAAAAQDVDRGGLAYSAPARRLSIGQRQVIAEPDHSLLVNHRGGPDVFQIVSAADVLDDKVGDVLKGAVVIIGFTELGQDAVRTPFTTHLPGAALHANVVSNLLRGDLLRRSAAWLDALIILAAGLLGAALFSTRLRWSALFRVLLAFGVALLWAAVAHLAFARGLLWVPIIAPVTTLLAAAAAGLAVAYGAEGVMRVRLRRTFAHYLSDDVIEDLLSNPDALALGGARRQLTVMFTDIRRFTTLSEGLEPLELVKFLNAYLTPMTRAVLDHRGLLDKYIGDALMAVFGAPIARDDHVDNALACALTMHTSLEQLRGELGAFGRELEIGVGINTGDMVVGNMGSRERFDYTVVGDAVNLASRVEGLTKNYGVFCLVAQDSRGAASERFQFREVDLVKVKGKNKPVAIFELLGDGDTTIVVYEDLACFRAALAAYREGDFAAARAGFSEFAEKNPADLAAPLFLERIAALGTPPEDWDGVFAFMQK